MFCKQTCSYDYGIHGVINKVVVSIYKFEYCLMVNLVKNIGKCDE